MVALSKLVGEEDGEVEGPGRCWHSMAWQAHCYAVVDVQDGEDLEGGEAMEGGDEYKAGNKVEVDAGCKVLRSSPRTGVGGGRPSGAGRGQRVVSSSQQRMDDEKDGEIWYVVPEPGILAI